MTFSGLQQLLELPALADLVIVDCDDSSDDEGCNPQHYHAQDQLPAALDDLRAWFKTTGRDLVVKHSADAQSLC